MNQLRSKGRDLAAWAMTLTGGLMAAVAGTWTVAALLWLLGSLIATARSVTVWGVILNFGPILVVGGMPTWLGLFLLRRGLRRRHPSMAETFD